MARREGGKVTRTRRLESLRYASDFHKPKHIYSWKTLIPAGKDAVGKNLKGRQRSRRELI